MCMAWYIWFTHFIMSRLGYPIHIPVFCHFVLFADTRPHTSTTTTLTNHTFTLYTYLFQYLGTQLYSDVTVRYKSSKINPLHSRGDEEGESKLLL